MWWNLRQSRSRWLYLLFYKATAKQHCKNFWLLLFAPLITQWRHKMHNEKQKYKAHMRWQKSLNFVHNPLFSFLRSIHREKEQCKWILKKENVKQKQASAGEQWITNFELCAWIIWLHFLKHILLILKLVSGLEKN